MAARGGKRKQAVSGARVGDDLLSTVARATTEVGGSFSAAPWRGELSGEAGDGDGDGDGWDADGTRTKLESTVLRPDG